MAVSFTPINNWQIGQYLQFVYAGRGLTWPGTAGGQEIFRKYTHLVRNRFEHNNILIGQFMEQHNSK